MSGLMKGKRGLVMGVANNHSIAWGIAKTLADHGAELAFTYQGDALKSALNPWLQRPVRNFFFLAMLKILPLLMRFLMKSKPNGAVLIFSFMRLLSPTNRS